MSVPCYFRRVVNITIIETTLERKRLREIAQGQFGDMVKAVVDVSKEIIAVGGEMHADGEAFLIDHGSRQDDLWGINLYPDAPPQTWIEFDSLINLRPSQGNRTRGVDDPALRETIRRIVETRVRDS